MSRPFAVFDHPLHEVPTEVPSYYSSWGAAKLHAMGIKERLAQDGWILDSLNQEMNHDLFLCMYHDGRRHAIHIIPTRFVSDWYQATEPLSRDLAKEDLNDAGLEPS
jgi:hypothetical protein